MKSCDVLELPAFTVVRQTTDLSLSRCFGLLHEHTCGILRYPASSQTVEPSDFLASSDGRVESRLQLVQVLVLVPP